MAGTAWPTITDGQKFKASTLERRFDWIEGSVIPHLAGVVADGVYDLGTTTAKWNNAYGKNLYQTDLLVVPSTGVGRLPSGTGTSSFVIKRSDDSNINRFSIYADELGVYMSGSVLALKINTDGTLQLRNGAAINEFSTDGTLSGNSDLAVPTEAAVATYALANLNQKYNFADGTLAIHNTTTNALVASMSFDPDTTLSIFDIDVFGFINLQLSTAAGTPGRVGLLFDIATQPLRMMAEQHVQNALATSFYSLRAHHRYSSVSHVGTFTVEMYLNRGAAGNVATVLSYGLFISPEIAT